MKINFNGWSHVDRYNLDTVVDLVLTNGTIENIQADTWLLNKIETESNHKSILDFGCGVGRNIFQFSTERPNWNFIGYDNVNMIEKAKEFSKKRFNKSVEEYSNVKLINDWQLIKSKRFDCIYATIVFQHIHETDLNLYLQDIKQMTSKLIVSGRRFNDDIVEGKFKNTWQILENNGYYPSNARDINYLTDGDSEEHITCLYDI